MRYSIEKSYVFVVLEHHRDLREGKSDDCLLHGVYTDYEIAEGKRIKIQKNKIHGYISILKKPINGIIRENKTYWEHLGEI